MNVGLVYHQADKEIQEALVNKLGDLAKANGFDLNLIAVVIDDYTAGRLVNKLEEIELVINALSFNFLASENIFASEWIDFLHTGNKVLALLFRPCIWELTYYSTFSCLPESGKPLVELDYSSSAFLRKVEEIFDYLQAKNNSDADFRSGLSKAELEEIEGLMINDKLEDAIHLLKQSAETMQQHDKDSVNALLARLKRLEKEMIDGIISYEDLDLTRNKLRRSFLDLVAKLSS